MQIRFFILKILYVDIGQHTIRMIQIFQNHINFPDAARRQLNGIFDGVPLFPAVNREYVRMIAPDAGSLVSDKSLIHNLERYAVGSIVASCPVVGNIDAA